MERKCRAQDLSAFLDDELNPKKRIEVKHHLGECHNCQSALDRMRHSWDLLLELPAPQVSNDFRARVWQALGQGDAPLSWRWAWLIHPQSVVGRVALAFGSFLLIWSLGISVGTGLYLRQARFQKAVLTPMIRLTQTTPMNSIFEVYRKRQ